LERLHLKIVIGTFFLNLKKCRLKTPEIAPKKFRGQFNKAAPLVIGKVEIYFYMLNILLQLKALSNEIAPEHLFI
jgi:hypothetical protein